LKEGDRLALNWLDSSLNLENANITTAKLFMLLSQYYDEFLYSLNITTKKYFPQGKFTERGERL
ncbi:MAG: hypothetical protein HUJ67_06170, partial [Ruminiclostridium sp.]|nr:hypothetical protein [Ruminiclostridium sp.]